MTDAETRAYRRGYSRGYVARSYHKWPEYVPPVPPDDVIGGIVRAALEMRSEMDTCFAIFDEDDEIFAPLRKKVDALADELTRLNNYCMTKIQENSPAPEKGDK